MFGRKRWAAAALAGGLAALVALVGCEREPSVASRSAAAFREAQQKGETFEGAAHGHGHGAMTPGGGHEAADAGHHEHEDTAPPLDDHGAAHGEGAAGPSGMEHGGAHQDAGHGGHAGMSHGRSSAAPGGKPAEGQAPAEEHAGHAGHGAMPSAPPAADSQPSHTGHAGHSPSPGDMPPAPAVAAPQAVSPGQPAATLQPGPLDAPAATSVLDAQRSAEMAEEMAGGGHGGHGGHGAGTYRHVDAGRGPGASEAAANEGAAVYACPMHPEVTSHAPGKCPKCGMALVERRKE